MRGRVKRESSSSARSSPHRHNLSLTSGPGDDVPALRGVAFEAAATARTLPKDVVDASRDRGSSRARTNRWGRHR